MRIKRREEREEEEELGGEDGDFFVFYAVFP